jgi:hypothetical protein
MSRANYRLPDGRQVQTTIGRVWTERGRPPRGYFTKRTAQGWLRDILDQAERDVLPGWFLRSRGNDGQRTIGAWHCVLAPQADRYAGQACISDGGSGWP